MTSGCMSDNSPNIDITQQEVMIDENETEELGFRVQNNYNETSAFQAELVPQDTERDYIRVLKDGENQTEFDLGDAGEGRFTSWEYVNLQGIHENIDGAAVTLDVVLDIYREDVEESVKSENITVTVSN